MKKVVTSSVYGKFGNSKHYKDRNFKYKYKGYTLIQNLYNYHYIIYDKKQRFVSHVECNIKLDKTHAMRAINLCILIENIYNEFLENEVNK